MHTTPPPLPSSLQYLCILAFLALSPTTQLLTPNFNSHQFPIYHTVDYYYFVPSYMLFLQHGIPYFPIFPMKMIFILQKPRSKAISSVQSSFSPPVIIHPYSTFLQHTISISFE